MLDSNIKLTVVPANVGLGFWGGKHASLLSFKGIIILVRYTLHYNVHNKYIIKPLEHNKLVCLPPENPSPTFTGTPVSWTLEWFIKLWLVGLAVINALAININNTNLVFFPVPVAGFEPSTLRLWVECSTTVLWGTTRWKHLLFVIAPIMLRF